MAESPKHPDERTIVERLEWLADNAMADEVNMGLRDIIHDIEGCIEDGLRDCGHCGSPFTFRRSDGDIECYDCPGIMPHPPDINVGACPDCGALDTEARRPASRAGFDDGPLQEQGRVIICGACGAEKLVINAAEVRV